MYKRQELATSKRVLVLSHYNPDGDALGSSLALYLGLKSLGKSVKIINETTISDRYLFLPSIGDISTTPSDFEFDLIAACDCGDRKRIGDTLGQILPKESKILNIDHHSSNTLFGFLNWVEGEASSTAEMIYNLLVDLKVTLTKEIATNLLTGIMTDTGSFRYASTTSETLRVAAKLLESGARVNEISQNVFEARSRESVLLGAKAVSGIKFLADGKIALMMVTQDMLKETGASLDDTEGLVEEGRSIKGVIVSALMKENIDQWQVSLRSSSPEIDVSKIATLFGGGGHKAAAAMRWKKSAGDHRERLVAELTKIFP